MRKKNKTPINTAMTYGDFYKKNISLKQIKIPILKQIAKNNKLKTAGNKQVLIDQISNYFHKNKMANILQKIFRGYLVRSFFIKREPCICVNDTDFYTMDFLSEIKYPFLYIYKEDKIVYGFHLHSLYTLIKKSGSLYEIKNPYNRNLFPIETINHVCKLIRISNIFYPTTPTEQKINCSISNIRNTMNTRNTRRTRRLLNLYSQDTQETEIYQQRIEQLTEIRTKSIEERVRILFTEINHLGNYVTDRWFFEIRTVSNYLLFYRVLFNIWYHYSHMSTEVRKKICMSGDPFENIIAFTNTVSLQNIQENCLRVMENMIFMGIDDEYKKLGTFHALSALTVVSVGARQSMYWLYESLIVMM